MAVTGTRDEEVTVMAVTAMKGEAVASEGTATVVTAMTDEAEGTGTKDEIGTKEEAAEIGTTTAGRGGSAGRDEDAGNG